MKLFSRFMMAIAIACLYSLTSCFGDEPNSGKDKNSAYGTLGSNLITVGSTRDLTYTSCTLLGTVDFPKITSSHTYGIVYMEALKNPDFDYNGKLQYGGHNEPNEKEEYNCTTLAITNSATDGKFEKKLVDLKPDTKYYYRAYVSIGQNVNYSKVNSFTTKNPLSVIKMTTNDPTDISVLSGTMNGVINIGKLQDVNEDQTYGFIYTMSDQLGTADKLTHEYYENWTKNHFDTESALPAPEEITTTTNLDGKVSHKVAYLKPNTTYYYRTFFRWNNKYFYSQEIKQFKTNDIDGVSVTTHKPSSIMHTSALLNATIDIPKGVFSDVKYGFLISAENASPEKLCIEAANDWDLRYTYGYSNFYIETNRLEKDCHLEIDGLYPTTKYYTRAYVKLGRYKENGVLKDIVVHGPIQTFQTNDYPNIKDEPNVTIWSDGEYPWREIEEGVWVSGNKGIPSSSSTLKIRVRHKIYQALLIEYKVSSQPNYDELSMPIYSHDTYVSESGNKSHYDHFIAFYEDGETVLQWTYSKDSSIDEGDDCAIIKNIRLGYVGH